MLLLSYESVGDVVRRGFARPPDRLLRTLVDDPSIGRLLVVGPYRSRLVRAGRRLLGHREPTLDAGPTTATMEPLRLRRRDPTSVKKVARAYERYDSQVAAAARRHGMHRPAVISFHPLAAGFAPWSWARSVTYYARDDWASLPAYQPWWSACRQAYQELRSRRRRVVAVSEVLLERLSPTGPSIVLPNGVDPTEWDRVVPPPAWFDALPRPRFLYLGTLDDRLDLEAVHTLATAYPRGSVVLAGPMPPGSPVGEISTPNVRIARSQPRDQVVALVQHSDVCLLTHRRTPLTEAMSPLKLYEYLAGGRPTVATDLRPVRGIDDRVVTYGASDDVELAAARALALGPATERERSAFVAANSWQERHRAVLEIAFA